VTAALRSQTPARRQRGPISAAVAKVTPRITTVALIPRAGMLPKHAGDTFSLTTTLREKSMPVAQHLSYAGSRSRTKRSRQIDRPSFAYLSSHHDQAPRAQSQQASSRRLAIAPVPAAPRSILRGVARFAQAAEEILWAIASWIFTEFLDGCAAYALSMYGMPETADHEEPGEATPCGPPAPARSSSRPALHVISACAEADIRAGEKCAARSTPMPRPRAGWRIAIVASAVRLLSNIRDGYARDRAIAELQTMDDRSLRDIGISRADISYIAKARSAA
jgi:uncharacterized protein YjiS (DUF1127 family)